MSNAPKSAPEQLNLFEKKFVISVQQIITYSITFLTIGASIYTFFKALPKIDSLDASIHKLEVSNGVLEQQIKNIMTPFEPKINIQEKKNP